jgi:hypothetical protein
VQPGGDGLELVTGDGLEALELPRAAGMFAVSLWLYSRGRPDEVRRLPALPHPAQALAVITAADRCYFLAAASGCQTHARVLKTPRHRCLNRDRHRPAWMLRHRT